MDYWSDHLYDPEERARRARARGEPATGVVSELLREAIQGTYGPALGEGPPDLFKRREPPGGPWPDEEPQEEAIEREAQDMPARTRPPGPGRLMEPKPIRYTGGIRKALSELGRGIAKPFTDPEEAFEPVRQSLHGLSELSKGGMIANDPDYLDWLRKKRDANTERIAAGAQERDDMARSLLEEDVGTGFRHTDLSQLLPPEAEPRQATPADRQQLRQLLEPQRESTPLSDVPVQQSMPPVHQGLGEMPGTPPWQAGQPPQDIGVSPRGQAFEDTVEDAPRLEELENKRMWASIAEGLNLAGRSAVGLSGAPIPQGDDTARNLRREEAELEDTVTPAEARMLRAYGLDVNAGMRRSRVAPFLPELGASQRQRERQDWASEEGREERKSREGIAGARSRDEWLRWIAARDERRRKEDVRVAERKEDMDIAAKKRAEDMEMAERKFGRFSDKELEQVTAIDQVMDELQSLLKERQEKGYYTGPFDKMGAWVGEKTGLISDESAEWRRRLTAFQNKAIHKLTGAQMSAAEAARLVRGMPTEGDQETQFDAKMRGTLNDMRRERDLFLKNRRWVGKDTSAFETVPYQVPGRGIADVPAGDESGFLERYPNAVRQRR